MRVIGQIFEEKNYDVFRRLPDNRDVLSRRFNQLVASLSERYILNPIIVNEKMEIIDGQGRFEARKALDLPIHYIIVDGANSDDCRRMNKYNTKWSSLDFAKSYSKAGVKAYINLLAACKETGLNISKVLRITSHGRGAGNASVMTGFELGKLTFTTEDLAKAIEVNKKVEEISYALQFSGAKNDNFYTAITIVTNTYGYDHKRMIKKCAEQRSTFAQMARLGDQLTEFERIYNYKSNKNNRLYFSDYMRSQNYRIHEEIYSTYYDEDVSTLKGE